MVEMHWFHEIGEVAFIASKLRNGTAQALIWWPDRTMPDAAEAGGHFRSIDEARSWLQVRLRELKQSGATAAAATCIPKPTPSSLRSRDTKRAGPRRTGPLGDDGAAATV